jgi:hypothetical protein
MITTIESERATGAVKIDFLGLAYERCKRFGRFSRLNDLKGEKEGVRGYGESSRRRERNGEHHDMLNKGLICSQ